MGYRSAHERNTTIVFFIIDADTYDIVIHPEFYEKCEREKFFKDFFIMLIFDGLENKYEISMCREYRILKNRKAMGALVMQNVRSKSKPFIMEMDPSMYEMERDIPGNTTYLAVTISYCAIALHSGIYEV